MGNINDNFIDYLSTIVGKESEKIITQAQLADMIECTTVSMSRYMSKQRKMPLNIAFKIKKALNISDEKFMLFYNEYSTKDDVNNLTHKINKLNNESIKKLNEYIDYLLYTQNNSYEQNNNKIKQLKK